MLKVTGGRSGKGRAPRTINLCFTVLSMALDSAVKQRLLPFNPADSDHVERMEQKRPRFGSWTPEQVTTFMAQVAEDRYTAAWRLTFCGLRRSEALGLTWDAVDLDAGTVTIRQSRTARRGKQDDLPRTIVGDPKTDNGERIIPIPPEAVDALRAYRKVQQRERLALGRPLRETDFVVVDEGGRPVSPEWYSAMFREHRDAAGLPAIRLHDARRTAATLLHTEYDVPADAAASYLGHDPVTYHRTYVVGETGHDKVRDALRRMQTGTDG
ncbi:MAG: site-specific integrase [Candidatus Nanopelagicales bacterium]